MLRLVWVRVVKNWFGKNANQEQSKGWQHCRWSHLNASEFPFNDRIKEALTRESWTWCFWRKPFQPNSVATLKSGGLTKRTKMNRYEFLFLRNSRVCVTFLSRFICGDLHHHYHRLLQRWAKWFSDIPDNWFEIGIISPEALMGAKFQKFLNKQKMLSNQISIKLSSEQFQSSVDENRGSKPSINDSRL